MTLNMETSWKNLKQFWKKKIKSRKATGLDEIPPEVWKTIKFNDIFLQSCNAVHRKHNREMNERQQPPLSEEGWPRNN